MQGESRLSGVPQGGKEKITCAKAEIMITIKIHGMASSFDDDQLDIGSRLLKGRLKRQALT